MRTFTGSSIWYGALIALMHSPPRCAGSNAGVGVRPRGVHVSLVRSHRTARNAERYSARSGCAQPARNGGMLARREADARIVPPGVHDALRRQSGLNVIGMRQTERMAQLVREGAGLRAAAVPR